MSLPQFLAGMAQTAGAKYGSTGKVENGVRPFGAYGMLMENWNDWAASAGLGGVDKFDPSAQDSVAAHMAQKLFSQFGDWGLVAAAWYAGVEQTKQAAMSGKGVNFFKEPSTKKFLATFNENFAKYENAQLPKAAQKWANGGDVPKGWLSPVAGATEYSGGSWMPSTTNHRGRTHAAIDVYAKRGAPIVAPVGGTIISTKVGKLGGNTVRMRGDDGLIYYFAHMDTKAVVKNGEKVTPGSHLGFVGNSGSARRTKPHLHFSIKRGNVAINPKTYLDGSKNAGNYYAPQDAAHEMSGPQQSTSEKFDALLESVSNKVAGGNRTDYRTIGMVADPETDETVSNFDSRKETI